jgi:hypothetical protein
MQSLSLQPAIPLGSILGFARRYCLPLHVAGQVRSAAFQRLDMIDDIAGASPARPPRVWAWMLPLLAAADLLIRPHLFLLLADYVARLVQ